jgi:uncharacterized RDD family membrane protein YckC
MGGQPGGSPQWTSNLTARGSISGPAGVALADVPERVIAYIIDAIIIGLIGIVIGLVLGSVLGPSFIAQILGVALTLAVSAGYFIYQWSRMGGQTVGMKVLKLAVRDEATGAPPSQQQAINRWLVLGLPGALSLAYVIPLLGLIVSIAVFVYYIYLLVTTAQSPTRQGFHDKFAKTVVAKLPA